MLAFILAVNVISPYFTTVYAAEDNIIDINKPIVTIREDLGDGTSQNSEDDWLKFQDKNGKILYVSKKPLRYTICLGMILIMLG